MVRRSTALQDTQNKERLTAIAVHPSLAEKLSLSAGQRVIARQGDSQVTLPLRLDNRLAHDAVFIPSALAETAGFGHASAPVTLQREVG